MRYKLGASPFQKKKKKGRPERNRQRYELKSRFSLFTFFLLLRIYKKRVDFYILSS